MAYSSTIPTLPLDLLEEILYRTPAESLVRAKWTCKEWNGLINKKRFIYEHLRRSPERFLRLDQTVQVLDLVNRTRSDSPIPDELQPSLSNIIAMVHCDGLMLCIWSDKECYMFHNLALWNPLTRHFNVVEPRLSRESQRFLINDHFGIGYDVNKPRGDYKILMFSASHYGQAVVEIYECMSKSWKTLDDSKVDWEVYTSRQSASRNGVSVMGNMYWLVKKKTRNYILCFDFSVETFKEICFFRDLPYDNNYLGCFEGDKLSLLQQNEDQPSPIEVWVSSKLADGNVSFTRYFSVASPDLPALRFFTYWGYPAHCIIAKHKRIVTWYDRVSVGLILCEIDEGGVSNQFVTPQHYWDDCVIGTFFCGYVYKPSLVPLP